MKTIFSVIIGLGLPLVHCDAEQSEIQKIEVRLEELKVIWKEDQGIINAYTKNRTQAVREGSKEYYACLDASKRIQQMEKEAADLKAKKKNLGSGSSSQSSNGTVEGDENWRVINKDLPALTYERIKHGPKVKDFFVGMTVNQFRDNAAKILETPYRNLQATRNTTLVVVTMVAGVPPTFPIAEGRYIVAPSEFAFGVMANQAVIGFGNPDGIITGIIISGMYAKAFFKAENLQLDKFVELFSESYQVDFEPILDKIPLMYEGLSPEGIKITISNDFGVTMVQGERLSETKKAFD